MLINSSIIGVKFHEGAHDKLLEQQTTITKERLKIWCNQCWTYVDQPHDCKIAPLERQWR